MKDLYLPSKYRGFDPYAVVDQHPFATVITKEDLTISHLPLLREGELLIGHLARANPQATRLEGADTLAIFHGPHAYISPLWYEQCDVPTWNYRVVHAHGRARLLGERETDRALRALSARMEGENGWEYAIPKDLTHTLHRVIVGFEIRVERWEAKDKLGQNRAVADRVGAIAGLRARGDHALADAMERLLPAKED